MQVFVRRKVAPHQLAADVMVPAELAMADGPVTTDVVELHLPEAQQDTTRYRPVPGGCSIGPEATVSAGTLGGFACDDTDSTIVQLSNNHVISGLDAMPALRRIVQPGRLDGGVLPGDVIGALKRHVVVNTVPNVAGANPAVSVVDAAIGTGTVARTDEIRQLGVPAIYELQAPALGMNVQKRGRTTRLTTNGTVTSINVTTLITYRNQTRLGRVQNAFIITSTNGANFSAAGDSGSLILNQVRGELNGTFPVVGLLFAGGADNAGTPITIANDINAVFGALDIETVCTCVARAIIRADLRQPGGRGPRRQWPAAGQGAAATPLPRRPRAERCLRPGLRGHGPARGGARRARAVQRRRGVPAAGQGPAPVRRARATRRMCSRPGSTPRRRRRSWPSAPA